MRFKEFKGTIKAWGEKYGYETEVEIELRYVCVKTNSGTDFQTIAEIGMDSKLILDTDWRLFENIEKGARAELFDILVDLAKTPLGDRKDEKRFIIPLYRARLKVITNEFIASYLRTQSSDAEERLKALEIGSKYIHEDYRHLSEFTEDELKKLNIWDSEQWEVEEVEDEI